VIDAWTVRFVTVSIDPGNLGIVLSAYGGAPRWLAADPAATEHRRRAARSVVDRVGGDIRSMQPPQAAS
jgi:hypothetical protein